MVCSFRVRGHDVAWPYGGIGAGRRRCVSRRRGRFDVDRTYALALWCAGRRANFARLGLPLQICTELRMSYWEGSSPVTNLIPNSPILFSYNFRRFALLRAF